jgi:hypothetical protein
MPPKLKQYLNRSIVVSIPALFEDGKCRPYTLQSIEEDGLWLSSDTLTQRLLPESDRNIAGPAQSVFVPAVQIAAIILPVLTAPAARPAAAATPAGASAAETATATKQGTPRRAKAAAARATPPAGTTARRQK